MDKNSNTHRRKIETAQSGTARAALLGISDGLVTNVSLILGVAAAGAHQDLVRVAGIASLIAGACSMAVGEYISMRGQVELLQSVLVIEREQLHDNPKSAHESLEKVLMADGVSKDTAHAAALEISHDPEKAMAVYARGELGINPGELGAAWGSAASSFITFSIGAFVPLAPWFALSGMTGVFVSLGLSVLAALGIGSYLGYITSGHLGWPALRQLLVLIIAASATFFIGHLFHTSVT
ncbi:MAG TPA: VIT1/CCC1 transporter family protein [Candidatus Saccharimonadia bacterium]|jgi:VIT1/CCC1 family predicted Fe2+/Mn2+ transporter